jgi:hypothetical protein
VALTPEQERAYFAELEQVGESNVRSEMDHGRISPALVHLASRWLADKERQREASKASQIEIMRRSSEAAERASAAAERQATAAERANTRATIALAIAIVSMIVSVISIWVTHLDVHK